MIRRDSADLDELAARVQAFEQAHTSAGGAS